MTGADGAVEPCVDLSPDELIVDGFAGGGGASVTRSFDGYGFPLYSLEAEQHVIGAILIDNSAYDRVADLLRETHFFTGDHRIIYRVVSRMLEANLPVDLFTVTEEVQRAGEKVRDNFFAYLGELNANTPSAKNVRRYAEIVHSRALLRQLRAATWSIDDLLANPEGRDAPAVLEEAQEILFGVSAGAAISGGFKSLSQILTGAVQRIDQLAARADPHETVGVPTGFTDVDNLMGGMNPGDLIVVGGRTSMGKSAFALNIAEHVAVRKGLPVGIFSLEMPEEQLATRELASLARLNHFKMRKGALSVEDWTRLSETQARLARAPLFIDETSGIGPSEIRARSRRLFREQKQIGLIIVDYLQLMGGQSNRAENRAAEIGMYSKALKNLAKELHCPVMALSQVNRGVESRTDKRPNMSDLRESGNIEQDADVIMFLYRDEVYHKDTKAKGRAEVIIAKQRNGPLGTAHLTFLGEIMRFENFLDEARF